MRVPFSRSLTLAKELMTRSRLAMMCLVVASCLFQPQGSAAQKTNSTAPAQNKTPAVGRGPIAQPSKQPPQSVSPDAPVVTIRGICPNGAPPIGQKADTCTVVLTRREFEAMVTAVNTTNQVYTAAALRSLASGYTTLMALAEVGEKAGVEKDPVFQEAIRVARTRALADAYRRALKEKYGNPSDQEIEAYYKENVSKFEQVRIERILVPKVNPTRSQEKLTEFESKARKLAGQIRERAARGEDIGTLQAEVYTSLAIQAMPPPTELNQLQKNTLGASVQRELAGLKPGEVTNVQAEPAGFTIYKLRSRDALTLEQAKSQIVQDLLQRNVDTALKSAVDRVHAEFNEQFFSVESRK